MPGLLKQAIWHPEPPRALLCKHGPPVRNLDLVVEERAVGGALIVLAPHARTP